jgi:hypothetical protein
LDGWLVPGNSQGYVFETINRTAHLADRVGVFDRKQKARSEERAPVEGYG